MCRKVGRAGWSLLAAGSLALGQLALAQQPESAAWMTRGDECTISSQPTGGTSQLDMMRIEMALMADPATFQCEIHVQCNGKAMELHGMAPSESIRWKAVLLAKQQTTLPVRDCLAAYSQPLPAVPRMKPEALAREASAALPEALGTQAKTVTVQADQDGKVILHGEVSRFDEKFAASIACRKIKGCTSVVNQIHVIDSEKNSKPIMVATQQVKPPPPAVPPSSKPVMIPSVATLPSGNPVPIPTVPEAVLKASAAAPACPNWYTQLTDEPSKAAAIPIAKPKTSVAAASGQVESHTNPVPPLSVDDRSDKMVRQLPKQRDPVVAADMQLQLPDLPVWPAPAEHKTDRPAIQPVKVEVTAVDPGKRLELPLITPPAAPENKPDRPANEPSKLHDSITASAKQLELPALPSSTAASPNRNGTAMNIPNTTPSTPDAFAQGNKGASPYAHWYQKRAEETAAVQTPPPAKPQEVNQPVVRLPQPRLDSPVVQVGFNAPATAPSESVRVGAEAPVAPPLSLPPVPAPASQQRSSIRDMQVNYTPPPAPIAHSSITSGTISFESDPPRQPSISGELLKRRVESVCGPQAHDIRVVVNSPSEISLFLCVRSREDGVTLYDRINEMPELAPLKAHIEMEVDH
jgi:osmotically-inducible protein OsmY